MTELLKKWLLTAATFDTPNDQGKPEIKVESVDNRNLKDKNDPNEQDDPDDDKDDEDDNPDNEDDEPDNEELKAKKAQEKEERRQNRIQKRIDKLTATNKNYETEIANLKKQLAEKPVEGLTEEEVERRAAEKAKKLADEQEQERQKKTFDKTAKSLIDGAVKIDKEFEKKINDVAKETDTLMPQFMIEILADLDNKNGSDILAQLANDPDLYEEICTLSERRMVRRLDKMSEELKGTAKPRREREIPDPITPINDGANNRGNSLPKNPTQNMDDYVRIRRQQTEALRKTGKNIW